MVLFTILLLHKIESVMPIIIIIIIIIIVIIIIIIIIIIMQSFYLVELIPCKVFDH